MKKFLAIALSVLMILSVLPLSAFATVAETDVCKIGEVGYASLEAAYAAVKDGETITLLKDATLTTATTCPEWAKDAVFNPEKVGSVTIDGKKSDTENYKITVSGSGYFGRIAHYNLTMKNVDVVSEVMNCFQFEGYYKTNILKQTTLFENCNFVQNRAKDGGMFKVTGNGTGANCPADSQFDITFKNCTATTTDAVLFLVHHGSNFKFNLINSDFAFNDASSVSVGNSMFNVYHCGSFELNVDKDSTLTAAAAAGTKAHNYLFNIHDMTTSSYPEYIKNRKVVINLEEGATLKLAGGRTDNQFLATSNKYTLNDKGAKWVVSADVAKAGVKLPVLLDEGYKAQDWFVGDAVVANPYVNAEATEDVVLTHKFQTLAADADKLVIVYTDAEGNEKVHAYYKSMDTAVDGLRDLYAGPLADASIVDGDDEDTNLNNEIYAAAGSPVIKLLGNFADGYARPNWATDSTAGTWIPYDKNKVVTIVIDGAKSATENYTITYGSDAAGYTTQVFNNLSYYNLTLKNTNMLITMGGNTVDGVFLWNANDGHASVGTSYTIFENCYIKQTATNTNGNGCLFKMNGKAKFNGNLTEDPYKDDKFNLILKDTRVEVGTGIGHQAHWGSDVNIELHNSTMVLAGCAGDSSNNNDALLKYYEAGNGTVYIDATSKLISERTRDGATTCLLRILDNQKAPVSITLEKGAEFYLNDTGAMKNATLIYAGGAKTTVTDNGAVFKASANNAKTVVTLPSAFYDETGVAHIWQVDGYTVANPYTNAEATADVVFKHVKNEDPALNPNNVAFIAKEGEQTRYFDNLQDALNAAADGDTVTFLRDITASAAFKITNKNLTIDGKGFTLSDNNVDIAYVFDIFNDGGDGNFAVTFQNLKMKTMRGIRFRNAEINVIGCEFTTGKMLPIRAVMTSGLNVKFTVKDTTWKFDNITMGAMNSADEPFALFGDNAEANFEFNLVNSTLDLNKGNDTGGHTANASGFNFYTKGEVTINMDATSKIVTHSTMMSIFCSTGNDKSVTINLAKGATLEMNNSRTSGKSNFVICNVPCTINDEGANWIIGAEAAKNGLALPTVGGNSTWIVNGQLISAGEPYKNAEATESVKAEIFDMNSAATLMNGAGYKEGGIAFGMTISDALIGIVGEDAKFGILVASEFNAAFGFADLNPGYYIDLSTDVEGLKDAGEGKKTCILGFDGIPTDNYHATHLDLVAIGYIEYVNDAGETVVIYTPNTYTISYAELAAAAAK